MAFRDLARRLWYTLPERARIRWRTPGADEPPCPPALEGQDPYRQPVKSRSFYSRFGGLWTDILGASDIARGKRELGLISDAELRKLLFWIENGFVILERAVARGQVDSLNRSIERVWRKGHPKAWVSAIENGQGVARRLEPKDQGATDSQIKLIDVYEYLNAARDVIFAPRVQRFLELVFQRPPLAHQSLSFYRGSKQPIHQDTVFVRVSSPMELAASWVALEDIEEGSGELEYYPGSHRFEEFLFEERYKWVPPGSQQLGAYYEHLHRCAEQRGIEAQRFLARKGDVLIWSADLAHGGSAYTDTTKTRRSLVTHYCPNDVYPMYFHYGEHSRPLPWRRRSYFCFARKFEWRAGEDSAASRD